MISYQAAIKKIEADNFSAVYLLYGEETYLQEELIVTLKNRYLGENTQFGLERLDGSDYLLPDLANKINEPFLFGNRRLIIIKNPPYLTGARKKGNQKEDEDGAGSDSLTGENREIAGFSKFLTGVNTQNEQPDVIVVFASPAVDRRTKMFKQIDQYGTAVECKPLYREELGKWIKLEVTKRGKVIESDALERLLNSGNSSLHFLAQEINKYCLYLDENEKNISAATIDLLFSGSTQSNIFQLCDYLAEGRQNRALHVLEFLLTRKEKPLLILFMIARHYRLMLSAKCLLKEGLRQFDLMKKLAVPAFVAEKLVKQVSGYSAELLESIIFLFAETDWQIKRGLLEPDKAIELLIAEICCRQDNQQVAAMDR